jgi:hypothetical protein
MGMPSPPTLARVDSSTIKPFRLLYHSILHRVVLWPSSSEVLLSLRHMKIRLMQNMFTILHYTNILTNTLFHIDCYHIITPFLLSRRRYVFFPVPDPFILHGDLYIHSFAATTVTPSIHLYYYQDDFTYLTPFLLSRRHYVQYPVPVTF